MYIYMLYMQVYEYTKPEATICSKPLGSSHLLPAISSYAAHLLPCPFLWRHLLSPHISPVATLLTNIYRVNMCGS